MGEGGEKKSASGRERMASNGVHGELERRLWDAADEPRANSKLKASEYSIPVLGLIFLRYADHKFRLEVVHAPRKCERYKSGMGYAHRLNDSEDGTN